MSFLFDIALIGLILFMVLKGRKKGFVKSSYTILSIIISIILVVVLQQPITDYLKKSPIGTMVRDRVEIKLQSSADDANNSENDQTSAEITSKMELPKFFTNFLEDSIKKGTDAVDTMKQNVVVTLSDAITEAILKIASFIILFILVRILTYLVLNSLNIVMKLPVLSSINGLLGMIMGAFNGILLAYIICAVLTLLAPTEMLSSIGGIIERTLFVRYFYNNNLLLGIFI